MNNIHRFQLGSLSWPIVLCAMIAFPLVVQNAFYISTGITALMFITLAVGFDLVVGRIGALSLAPQLFFGFGAYFAALISTHFHVNFLLEIILGVLGAFILAVLIGIPSFRLSLHSFAIGTLGFALIGQIVAQNWVSLTGGPLCVKGGVGALQIPFPGGVFTASTLSEEYYVILAIATVTVALVYLLTRLRLGLAFSAVRDDPVLASARGLWPMEFRLAAFGLSGALSAAAGVFAAHFQGVVCPNSLDISYMVTLLIIVFIGGRASMRGVVSAAIVFTVLPQILRVADQWRLVIYAVILIVVVTTTPDGFEALFQFPQKLRRRLMGRRSSVNDEPSDTRNSRVP